MRIARHAALGVGDRLGVVSECCGGVVKVMRRAAHVSGQGWSHWAGASYISVGSVLGVSVVFEKARSAFSFPTWPHRASHYSCAKLKFEQAAI